MFLLRLRRDRPTLKICDFQNRVRNIALPLPCRKPCRAKQIPVRSSNPLKTLSVLNMGSHLPLGDRRARSSGGECANIRTTKFPYLFATRDITFTNYACCSACMYHLLARQDTDFVGMRTFALGEIPVRSSRHSEVGVFLFLKSV